MVYELVHLNPTYYGLFNNHSSGSNGLLENVKSVSKGREGLGGFVSK